jgi:hypothetical protein
MSTAKKLARDQSWVGLRRGARMNSRVEVCLQWVDSQGAEKQVVTRTLVVNPTGCLVRVPVDLPLEQAVRVIGPMHTEGCPAIVVWKGNETPEGYELGIELQNPGPNFWGLEL